MFQRCHHPRALVRISAQPVQQLREPPLGRVHAPAPCERFQILRAAGSGDLGGFALGAMVAPQIVIVQRPKALAHRNDARSGSVERQRRELPAVHARRLQRLAHRGDQRVHVVPVRLRGDDPGPPSCASADTRPWPSPTALSRYRKSIRGRSASRSQLRPRSQ